MPFLLTRRRCAAWLLASPPLAALAQAEPLRAPVPGFDLQGHRGTRGLRPENTLESFAHAMAIGVNTLELDIAITRDGVPVIAHDRRLNADITRGPDGQFLTAAGPPIAQLSKQELDRYDVGRIRPGTRYAAEFPEQQAVDGSRIPALADLFALVRRPGREHIRFAIEPKTSPNAPNETLAPEPFARAVVRAIRDGGMQHRASVLSFDWRALQVVQKEAPEIPTVYLTTQGANGGNVGRDPLAGTPWTAGHRLADHAGSLPRMIRDLGGHTWSANHQDLTPALVKEAQALGLKVLAWTVNEPGRMAAMLDMGIDGLVTDRADRAREVMRSRGMPLPPVVVGA